MTLNKLGKSSWSSKPIPKKPILRLILLEKKKRVVLLSSIFLATLKIEIQKRGGTITTVELLAGSGDWIGSLFVLRTNNWVKRN